MPDDDDSYDPMDSGVERSPAPRPQQFACRKGHVITAATADGEPLDLTNTFCPVCLGASGDPNAILEPRLLAPRQKPTT